MRKLLAVTGLLTALSIPAAHASIIPVLTSTSGNDFTYTATLTSVEQIYNPTFDNYLTLTGGSLGAGTTLVGTPTGFLSNFTYSTAANSISLTCAAGNTTCGTSTVNSITGPMTAMFTILGTSTSSMLGSYTAQAAKYTGDISNGTMTFNGGSVEVPATAIPEPASWALMLMGFAGLGFAAFRRRKDSVSALA
jgi:PEP-CTERM motif